MNAEAAIFMRLAQSEGCRREELARDTGLSERAFSSGLADLVAAGIVAGPGCRSGADRGIDPDSASALVIAGEFDWLDRDRIRAALAPDLRQSLQLDVLLHADSTNDELLARAAPEPGAMAVCIAEIQSAGRGRRGRNWTAPPGGSLCLSAAWTFSGTPPQLSTLSLVVAVAALRALSAATGLAVSVKWPNDLVVDGRKLGGILVETRTDSRLTHVVAGIGLNVSVPAPRLAEVCDWPRGAIDLATAGARFASRNDVAAALVTELDRALRTFAVGGFAPFEPEWSRAHVLHERHAVVAGGAEELSGIVRGIDREGALLLEHGGEVRRIVAGDVSLRAGT